MTTSPNNGPTNPLVSALLTDLYQLTMTYAHWKLNKHQEPAVFELFFRKNPFRGGYTVFAGGDECLKLVQTFSFSPDDILYLRSMPALKHAEDGYFEYLSNIDTELANCRISAVREGTVVFPKTPLITIEGPLGIGHLLETTLLNLVNYPSLICTNASRMVLRAAGVPCIEFGLRRAQGPDGAITASKYSYVGGFVGTSNVQAGKLFGIPVSGTHAHSYVQSFSSLDDARELTLKNQKSRQDEVFLDAVLKHRTDGTNDSELAAFCAYACAFPEACLCLIDTYDTLRSGLLNFLAVAKALDDFGYKAKGVRLDSGDLVALSRACQQAFDDLVESEPDRSAVFSNLTIVASNDINEKVLDDFARQGHSLTAYGIGTNLVTCQAQPALGCVYKLVECNNMPRIKLSQELAKVTLPGRKRIYRFYGEDGSAMVDCMFLADEAPPEAQTTPGAEGILCRHPFEHQNRFRVFPTKIVPLQDVVFDEGRFVAPNEVETLSETRNYVLRQLSEEFPEEVTQYANPTRYDVLVSPKLYRYLHELWETNAPVPELR